jgi:hypothetical protein
MAFSQQGITIAFGSPKHFIIHRTTDTMDNHRIPVIPSHSTFNPYLSNPIVLPVGLFLVCSMADY